MFYEKILNILRIKLEFKNQYTQILTLFSFSLILMSLLRLFLFFRYKTYFSDLTFSEILLSFFFGFRVDIITLFTFLGIFSILLSLPYKIFYNKYYKYFISIFYSTIFIFIFGICIGDILYFEFANRHISNELLIITNDIDIIVTMALKSLLPYTITSLLLFIFIYYLNIKILSANIKRIILGRYSYLNLILILVIIFLGIRNNIVRKPFGLTDAYSTSKISSGMLAINGFFSFYRTLSSYNGVKRNKLMDYNEALPIVKALLQSNKMNFISNEYPIQRAKQTSEEQKKYNILIVLLESFGAEHIDGFTKYEELNVTPFFKKLSNEGLKYTNFYANGYRSIAGITSVYSGVTVPLGFQALGNGLELSNLSYIGTIAKQNDYKTIAMQSSKKGSFRIDTISKFAGFDDFYGAEDMPNVEIIEDGKQTDSRTYDYNMFDFMHNKLNDINKPFLAFMFTSTSHTNYNLPQKKFEKYPHDLTNYNGFLNSLVYTDNAIERFMNNIKNEPWFDNTIFIFTADHGFSDALGDIGIKLRPNSKKLAEIEHSRIPLIIYAPKIFKPQTITTLGSQNDLLPTIVDLLNFKQPFSAIGNSLFDESVKNRFVYNSGGFTIGFLENNCFIIHSHQKIIDTNCSKKNQDNMEKKLKALDTIQVELLNINKWSK